MSDHAAGPNVEKCRTMEGELCALHEAAPELLDWLRAHVEAYGQCECRPDGIICPHCRAEALIERLTPSRAQEMPGRVTESDVGRPDD